MKIKSYEHYRYAVRRLKYLVRSINSFSLKTRKILQKEEQEKDILAGAVMRYLTNKGELNEDNT